MEDAAGRCSGFSLRHSNTSFLVKFALGSAFSSIFPGSGPGGSRVSKMFARCSVYANAHRQGRAWERALVNRHWSAVPSALGRARQRTAPQRLAPLAAHCAHRQRGVGTILHLFRILRSDCRQTLSRKMVWFLDLNFMLLHE